MYINLNEGKIWAAKFEMNAWDYSNAPWDADKKIQTKGKGLYLNSDPKAKDENNNLTPYSYYLKLGDLQSSYFTFDIDGNLRIKANSFYLTGTLGGSNLLKQTNPKQSIARTKTVNKKTVFDTDNDGNIIYDWDLSEWTGSRYVKADPQPTSSTFKNRDHYTYANSKYTKATTYSSGTTYYIKYSSTISGATSDGETYITVTRTNSDPAVISQTVEGLRIGKEYTVSGYAKRAGSSTSAIDFTIVAGNTTAAKGSNKTNTIKINDDWEYFEYTFVPNASDTATKRNIVIRFTSEQSFYLWHVKLEKGSVATEWSESEWDIENNIENTKTKYDNSAAGVE
jgi:hypothetical protein